MQDTQGDLLQLVLCALVILAVLGNSIVGKVFPYIFSGSVLERIWHFERKEKAVKTDASREELV